MKCLRCGTCCFYFVVVIKPEYVSEELNVDLLTEDMLLVLDGTKRCPHLEWQEDGRAFCKIHHYDWFRDTPCGKYSQIESKNNNCRMGEFLQKHPEIAEAKRREFRKLK